MERIVKNSRGKLLAFVVAFLVVFMTIGVLMPATASALQDPYPTKIADIGIETGVKPAPGVTVKQIIDGGANFYTYTVDAPEISEGYEIDVWVGDQMLPEDTVLQKDGFYEIWFTPVEEDIVKIAESPVVTINGVSSESGLAYWDSSYKAFALEVYFNTVTFDSAGGTPVDPQVIIRGSYPAYPVVPTKEGFEFWRWLKPDGKPFDWAVDTVMADMVLTAEWAPIHDVISGDGQTFYLESGDDIVIRFDADYNNFLDLSIYNPDTGFWLNTDTEGITVSSGSTVVTLSNALLKTLPAGNYNIDLTFMDANGNVSYAYATMSVVEGAAPSTTPATGDSSNIIAFAGMAGAAALGFAAVVIYRKKVTE